MEKSQLGDPYSAERASHGQFARHARAVGVLWGVFSLCFCIIVFVVFVQPHWIGAPRDTHPGHMGLWRWCSASSDNAEDVTCSGDITDFNTFTTGFLAHNNIHLITTILSALAVVITVISVVMMLLFLCVESATVYRTIGIIQILAGLLLGATVAVYPLGFDSGEVLRMCGPTARAYNVGECSIRWAYVLAIIGVVDAIVLAALALTLASKQVRIGREDSLLAPPQLYKDYGDGVSLAASRKSLNLQPVMTVPDDQYRHHYHL